MSKRRLVAIMFTDIEGYTALMQNSEEQAFLFRETHRRIFNECTAHFTGEIIQYYGDGTLSIFESAVDAIQCGIAMQRAFQKDPKIPVRIGIHSGDIVVTEEDIIGDGVNVASRIESLAVAGSVLISEKVFDEVKNSDAIQTTYLDSFKLKNVKRPLGVYAVSNEGLVVPKRSEIKGKLEPAKRIPRVSLLIVALLFLALGWVFWGKGPNDGRLPKDILESRIAVLPFENKTNDEDLDMLGDMAADWIVQALMNFDEFKVVSSETVREHLHYMKATAGNRLSFQARTGAEKIIKGSFYPDESDLIFQTQIMDARTLEIEFVFPEITGPSSDIGALVEELRERMLSYFFIKANLPDYQRHLLLENPPTFEAYKAFIQGVTIFGKNYEEARTYFEKAIELDPRFFRPYWYVFNTYWNQRQVTEADSIVRLIESRFERLQPYEQLFFNLAKESLTMDNATMYETAYKLFQKDPKHPGFNYIAGLTAAMANKPGRAVEIFEHLDPRAVTIELVSDSWWFDAYAYSLGRLNRLNEAMELLQDLPLEKVSWGVIYRKLDLFVQTDQADSIKYLIGELENRNFPITLIHGLYVGAIADYARKKDHENQKYWANLAVQKIENKPESVALDRHDLASAYYFSEQYDKALPFYRDFLNQSHSNPFFLRRTACCYAKLGQEQNALNIIKQLREMETPQAYGQIKYTIALIYAMLGEKEKSVEYLKLADREGMPFLPPYFDGEFELISLQGYPPYEEFVRPKM